MDELLPEAVSGTYDGTARLNPGVGACQGCGAVLQETGQADDGDLLTPAVQRSSVQPPRVPMLWILAATESKHLEMRAAGPSITGMRRYSMSGQRVFTTSGVVDDRADAVAEEQEVAVGGHRVTEVEDGGDLGCWGRGPSATAVGVRWLCLETPVEIHPALSPRRVPASRSPVPGSPGGVREQQWGRAEPPMATTDAHATAMATEEQGGAWPRLTFFPPPQSRQLSGPRCGVGGTLTPSWGCGTLTMAGRPLTAGWGWGTRHAILGLGDILHGLGLWEQVGGGARHPPVPCCV